MVWHSLSNQAWFVGIDDWLLIQQCFTSNMYVVIKNGSVDLQMVQIVLVFKIVNILSMDIGNVRSSNPRNGGCPRKRSRPSWYSCDVEELCWVLKSGAAKVIGLFFCAYFLFASMRLFSRSWMQTLTVSDSLFKSVYHAVWCRIHPLRSSVLV